MDVKLKLKINIRYGALSVKPLIMKAKFKIILKNKKSLFGLFFLFVLTTILVFPLSSLSSKSTFEILSNFIVQKVADNPNQEIIIDMQSGDSSNFRQSGVNFPLLEDENYLYGAFSYRYLRSCKYNDYSFRALDQRLIDNESIVGSFVRYDIDRKKSMYCSLNKLRSKYDTGFAGLNGFVEANGVRFFPLYVSESIETKLIDIFKLNSVEELIMNTNYPLILSYEGNEYNFVCAGTYKPKSSDYEIYNDFFGTDFFITHYKIFDFFKKESMIFQYDSVYPKQTSKYLGVLERGINADVDMNFNLCSSQETRNGLNSIYEECRDYYVSFKYYIFVVLLVIDILCLLTSALLSVVSFRLLFPRRFLLINALVLAQIAIAFLALWLFQKIHTSSYFLYFFTTKSLSLISLSLLLSFISILVTYIFINLTDKIKGKNAN